MKKSLLIASSLICALLLDAQTAKCQDLTVQNKTSCTLEMQLTIWEPTPNTGQQQNNLFIPPGGSVTYPLYTVFSTASSGSFWAGFKAINPCSAPGGVPNVDIVGVEPSDPQNAMSVTPCTIGGTTQNCGHVQASWKDLGGGNVLIELL